MAVGGRERTLRQLHQRRIAEGVQARHRAQDNLGLQGCERTRSVRLQLRRKLQDAAEKNSFASVSLVVQLRSLEVEHGLSEVATSQRAQTCWRNKS